MTRRGDVSLQELLDKQSITEVLHRYCDALDRNDRDLAATIWHPGGTADYQLGDPEDGIMPTFTGAADSFLDWVLERHTTFAGTSHQVTNILVDVNGDEASSRSYVTAALWTHDEVTTIRARYLDTFSRRGGRWAIEHRVTEHDLKVTAPRGASSRASDREAIRTLAVAYCRALDEEDPDGMKSVFWPEATDDHGTLFVGKAWDFADRFVSWRERVRPTMHVVWNHIIDFDGEDRARGWCSGGGLQFAHGRPEPRTRLVVGHYADEYERRAGEWRISARTFRLAGTMTEAGR
jgi:hypothetical protein